MYYVVYCLLWSCAVGLVRLHRIVRAKTQRVHLQRAHLGAWSTPHAKTSRTVRGTRSHTRTPRTHGTSMAASLQCRTAHAWGRVREARPGPLRGPLRGALLREAHERPCCSCQRAMAAAGGAIEGSAQNGAQSVNFGFAPHAPLFHRRSCAFSYAPKKTKPPIVIQPKRGTTPAKSAPAPSSATIVRRPRSVPSPL